MLPLHWRRHIDWFLLGMIGAVLLAWAFPEPGAQGGWMHPELVTNLGVALIFLLHGLLLPLASLKDGVKRWKLHLIVQISTFVWMPLLGLLALSLFGQAIPQELHLGLFFLCALPSTVSSSVAMTAAAHGNVSAAVFNATLSSLLGIVLTPLWIHFYAHAGVTPPLGSVMWNLMCWLLLPLLVGQLLRPWLGAWMLGHKRWVSMVDRMTILLLVYTSFCDSMKWGVWSSHGHGILFIAGAAALLLFGIIFFTTVTACRLLKLDAADKAAAVFCGSKKSLAQGVPLAQLMFTNNAAIGMILLPIMIYHPLQLFLCGMIAGRWGRAAASTTRP